MLYNIVYIYLHIYIICYCVYTSGMVEIRIVEINFSARSSVG